MRLRDIWLVAAVALAVPTLTVPALAQIAIRPGVTGQQGTFSTDGNLCLDGHCFGSVSSPPTDGVVTAFGGAASFKNGSLFARGSLNQSSGIFPEGINVRNGSTNLASITSAGALYLAGSCINSYGCSNTVWEPSKWNDGGTIQRCNNCYNYGNDTRTDSFAQPGCASVGCPNDVELTTIRNGAIGDGLTYIGDAFPGNTYDCGKGHLIFMAIYPGVDYHWWRLDQANSMWSHKRGNTAAQNTDDQTQPITNPLTSGRFGYTLNGGFYCNCGSKANLKGDRRYPRAGCLLEAAARMAAAPSTDSQAVFSVELDAFSGRPNPVFTLDQKEVDTVLAQVAGVCNSSSTMPDGGLKPYPTEFLGYRGLTVFRSEPQTAELPTLQFFRGTLRISGRNPPDACRSAISRGADLDLADAGQAIEKLILDIALAKGAIRDIEYKAFLKGMTGRW